MEQGSTLPSNKQNTWPSEVDRLADLQRELSLQRRNARKMRTRLVKEMLFNQTFIDSNLQILFSPKVSFKKPPPKRRLPEILSDFSLKAPINRTTFTAGARLLLDEQKEVELHICKSASLERELSLANEKLRKLINELRGGQQPHCSFLRDTGYSGGFEEAADN